MLFSDFFIACFVVPFSQEIVFEGFLFGPNIFAGADLNYPLRFQFFP